MISHKEMTISMIDKQNCTLAELQIENQRLSKKLSELELELEAMRSEAYRYQTEAWIHLHSRRYRLGDLLVNAAKSPFKLLRLPYDLLQLRHSVERPRVQSAKRTSAVKPIKRLPPAQYGREEIIELNRRYLHAYDFGENQPLVSIIICTHNGLDNLRRLLASLCDRSFYTHYELVVVDNASTDGTLAFLEEQKAHFEITVIRNEDNESFSHANNQGAQAAKGEYLLFLNNDIEVTDGWLDELLMCALEHPDASAVGAKLLYPEIPEDSINAGRSFYTQHTGIAFRASEFNGQTFVRPYNRCLQEAFTDGEDGQARRIAAVTAACLLMKKNVFDAIGGFEECYIYGYEDVDLCLKAYRGGYHNYYCPSALLFHYEFGTQSTSRHDEVIKRRTNNIRCFRARWNDVLTSELFADKLSGACLFSEAPLTVAFAVTEAHAAATAGDYFTAMELATALEKRGCRIQYLCRTSGADWYHVGEHVDVLISMLDSYDLSQIRGASPALLTIAWARNWFTRWCKNPSIRAYDILLASSETACAYMQKMTGREASLFPIATNADRFLSIMRAQEDDEMRARFESDYVFTGSYWNSERQITDALHPDTLPYRFRVFGKNWESVPAFAPYSGGFIHYDEIPYAYKYTKIVVDDANAATSGFGSVNSRVFDALACGRLVLTNGVKGAQETFHGMLPCFENAESFSRLLTQYMEDEALRSETVQKLQRFVLENHTYEVRADALLGMLGARMTIREKHIAILAPVPKWEQAEQWGDYHFAVAMKKCFETRGYTAEIRILPEWDRPFNGRTVIVLRGLNAYQPRPQHINIMWNISHPDDVPVEEYNQYDMVYVASDAWAQKLSSELTTRVEPLLQCCDPDVFAPGPEGDTHYELLFVGNSRKVFRKILRDLLPTPYDLSVYGTHWRGLIPSSCIKGQNIPNCVLSQTYRSCDILLNDHWDDMRDKGFISNRLFDGLASGAFIITDKVKGLDEVLPGCVVAYSDREDLKQKVQYYMEHPEERREIAARGQEIVRSEHTFMSRVSRMIAFIESQREEAR